MTLGDPPHRPHTMTDGAGQVTSYTYSSTSGQLLTVTNPKDETITFSYQDDPESAGYRRLLSITGDVPGGDRAFTYDDFDRIRTISTVDGSTITLDYDDLDRVRTVTYPDSSYEQYEYADHSLIASRDRSGQWTRYAYSALMQRVVTRDPAGTTTQTQWCRCGRLKRLVDGAGNITEWARDEAGRPTSKSTPTGATRTTGTTSRAAW